MLTEIGKILRIIRMNSGDNASDMAKKLYMSTSYLYLIENGKRKIPSGLEGNVAKAYRISDEEREAIRRAIDEEQIAKDESDILPADEAEEEIAEDYFGSDDAAPYSDNGETAGRDAEKRDKRTAVIIVEAIAIVLLLAAVIALTCIISAGKIKTSQENNGTGTSQNAHGIPVEPTPSEMFEYSEKDGQICITKFIGGDENVVVPSKIDGKNVYEIVDRAFANNKAVKSVVFSDGIERLGFHIFENCTNLVSLEIPDSVTYIGDGLAINCSNLKSVVIGDGATQIGGRAFWKCSSLHNVKLGKNLCQIDHDAFNSCVALAEIEIPDGVVAIHNSAFYGCTGLKNVVLPDGIMSVESRAFYGCTNLESVFVPSSLGFFGGDMFDNCPKLTVYGEENSGIELFCTDVGYNFRRLNEPTPAEMFEYEKKDGLIYITKYLGSDIYVLVPSEIGGVKVTRVGEKTFFDNEYVRCILIPTGIQIVGFKAFAECVNLECVSIPDSVTYLDNAAFEHCDYLKTVVIGSGVQTVGQCEFMGCFRLQSVTMNKYIRTIEHDAFSGCYALEQITLPERLNEIKYSAFNNCRSLKKVVLPSNVTSVGDYAFSECESLEYVFIPSSVTTIGKEIFTGSGDVTIYTTAGSYAEKYASENGYACIVVADVSQIK